MQLQLVTLSALVAAASAQHVARVSIPASDLPIIASVLPSSAEAFIAKSGEAAFSTKIASEFEAGSTPGWFTKLPTSIQSLLVQGNASVAANSSVPANATVTKGHHSITSTKTPVHLTNTRGHTRSAGHTVQNTQASASASGSAAASSSSSKGGASMPTAVIGAGLAGAVGIAGLFAL